MQARNDSYSKTETELFQERAEVLGRAGDALSQALQQLTAIGERVRKAMARGLHSEECQDAVNRDIEAFNGARDHARMRYYYLIVTREAMGFRRHTAVEETYKIPPRIKPLTRMEWTGTKSRE